MAMPDKMPLQWYNPQQQQWDEKDGHLMWLRGEFAAANAIIDALCHHLRAVGEPGEYENAVGCIQQRRFNWGPALYMQPYFSVAEVVSALQQVGWRRQQLKGGSRRGARGGGRPENDAGQKGPFSGENNVNGNGNVKSGACGTKKDEEKECDEKSEVDSSLTLSESSHAATSAVQTEDKKEIEGPIFTDSALQVKKNHEITPKTFIATEVFDGTSVNAAEGMKLYEDLFTDSKVSKLISLVNDLRTAGMRGQLQGRSYVVTKRPMRGHGREFIQLGSTVTDSPNEDESPSLPSKTEAIPDMLQNAIELLLAKKVLTTKPDTCFIDIFNEDDHSHPHMWPHWYARPVCMLFLTDCDMSFGKVITFDRQGDYRGALNVSLSPGSVLVMQGRSTDFSRHAIPSLKKQRILVTFLKSMPRKTNQRSTNRPQILRSNGVQPIFVPAPGIGYPPPPQTRLSKAVLPVIMGTGVFIPPSKTENSGDGSSSGEMNATSNGSCNGNRFSAIGEDEEKS